MWIALGNLDILSKENRESWGVALKAIQAIVLRNSRMAGVASDIMNQP